MEKRNFKIIALDLDGTLLNSERHVSKNNYDALKRAYDMGAAIVPCTGRLYGTMPEEVRSLDFVRYVIESNGAGIYDARLQRTVDTQLIDLKTAMAVYDYLDTVDCIYDCYVEGRALTAEAFYALAEPYCRNGYGAGFFQNTRQPVKDFRNYLLENGAELQKISVFFKNGDEKYPIIDELHRRFSNIVASSSVPNNIEINISTATKGHAIITLCRLIGADISETIAFGDALNDIPAIKMAGVGVAMANALPAVIDEADYVTLSNDKDGVAHALNELMFP